MLGWTAAGVHAAPGDQVGGFTTAGEVSSTAAIGPNNTVYVGSADGFLRALNSTLFPEFWRFPAAGPILSSPAIGQLSRDASNFQIYFGTVNTFVSADNSFFYALDSNGQLRWRNTFGAGGQVYASPAIGADGTVYVATFGVSKLYAFNPINGHTNWTFSPPVSALNSYLYSSPAIAVDGTIYIGSQDRNLYALDPSNGSIKWRFAADRRIDSSPAVALDGTIYFGTGNAEFPQGTLYALNPDGSKRWEYRIRGGIQSSPAIDHDGSILFGSFDGRFYSLSPNGALKWSFDAGGPIYSSPALGSDGTVYFSSDDFDNPFFGLATASGTQRFRARLATDFIHSSPALLSTSAVFGALDYSIYAVAIDFGQRRPQWPMFRGNPRHTGRSPFILRMLQPENGQTFLAPAVVRLQAEAFSSEGTVSLTFFQRREGESLFTRINDNTLRTAPFIFDWPVAGPGRYTLYARVIDGDFNLAESPEIVINVSGENSPPSIGEIPPQVAASGSTLQIPFTVSDDITPRKNLVGSVTSSDPNILAQGNGFVSMTSTNGFLFLNLTPDGVGKTLITLTIFDTDGKSSSTAFELEARKFNNPPEIAAPPGVREKTTPEDTPITLTGLLVYDQELAAVPNGLNLLVLEAASSAPEIIPPSNISFSGTGLNRNVTIRPATNRFGRAIISVLVTDPEGESAQTEFPITVTPVNDLPAISTIPDVILLGTLFTNVNFTVADVETPAANLVVTATSANPALVPPTGLVLSGTGTNRSLTITPVAGAAGTNRITVTVADAPTGGGATNTTFNLIIRQANRPPIASNLATNTPEDTPRAFALPATDPDGNPLAYRITAAPTLGSLVTNELPNVIYQPAANASGIDTFRFRVSDGTVESAEATVTIEILAVNDSPTLTPIPDQRTEEDRPGPRIDFTVADQETPAASLLVTASSSNTALLPNSTQNLVLGGTGANRTLNLLPLANQSGSSEISVVVNDGSTATTHRFTLTVNPLNDLPTITPIPNLTLLEDGPRQVLTFTIGDVESPVANLTVTASTTVPALLNTPLLVPGETGATRSLHIQPAPDQAGTTIVTLRVSDGTDFATITFTVTVTGVNDPPTLSDIRDLTINENTESPIIPFTIADPDTPLANLAVTTSSSNTKVVSNLGIVRGGTGADRTLVINPILNQTGVTTITVAVSDGTLTAFDTFQLTVVNLNDAPTITNLPDQVTDEDKTLGPLSFTIADADTPLTALAVSATADDATLIPPASILLGGSGANRAITLSPAPNRFGTATVQITVSDGVASATDSFRITVNPINDAPVFVTPPTSVTLPENAPVPALPFTVGDPDDDAGTLVLSATSSNPILLPANATNLVFTGSGSNRVVNLFPVSGHAGEALLTLTLRDVAGASSTHSLRLVVTDVAQPPVLGAIQDLTTFEDLPTPPILLDLRDDTTPVNAIRLTTTSSNPALLPNNNILVAFTAAGPTLTLRPATNASGVTTLTLTATDSDGLTATRQFTLTVTPVNDPPIINPLNGLAIDEDSGPFTLSFIVTDPDSPLTDLLVTPKSSNQSLLPDANLRVTGVPPQMQLRILAQSGQSGEATISLIAEDLDGGASTNRFTLLVLAVADAPEVSGLPERIDTPEDTASATFTFTIADAETPAAALVVTASSSNPSLLPPAAILLGGSGNTRTLTLQPAADQSGTATLTVFVSDEDQLTNITRIAVTVIPVNDPPVAVEDTFVLQEDTPLALAPTRLLANDRDADNPDLNIVAVSNPRNGTVSFQNGQVLFLPATNFNGTAGFTYTLSDGQATASAGVVIDVTPINDPPVLSPVPDQTIAENGIAGPVPFLIADAETPANNLLITATSSNPALLPETGIGLGGSGGSRTLTLTPTRGRSGVSTVTLSVSDGTLVTSDTFVLTVSSVDDAPLISALADLSLPEDTASAPLDFTVSDAETPAAELRVTGASSNPTLLDASGIDIRNAGGNGTRTVVLTPRRDQTGTTIVTLTVTDASNLSSSESFVLTVTEIPDPPSISSPADVTTDEDTATPPIAFTIGDAETPAGNLTLRAVTSDPAVVTADAILFSGGSNSRQVTLIPSPNATGSARVTLIVTDDSGATNSASFTLTVTPVNDAPTIVPVNNLRIDEGTPAFSLLFTVDDIDTPIANLLVTAASSEPQVLPDASLRPSGTTATRALRIQPVAGATGRTTITLIVDDKAGGRATNQFTLEIRGTPPVILTQPADATVYPGDTAAFTAVATGTAPLAYQWFRNNTPLPAATNATLQLVGVQAAQAGTYSLRVTNTAGSIDANPATLALIPLPTLTATATPVTEGTTTPNNAEIAVTLSAPIPRNVAVQFLTRDGSAQAPSDYSPTNGVLIIPPNTLSARLLLPVTPENVFEPDESFLLEFANATNATIATPRLTVTILNDDVEPVTGPSVALTSPATGAAFTAPAVIPLVATARSPGASIARVDFFAGTTPLGAAAAAPYTIQWTNSAVGAYSLTAVAIDSLGVSVTSAPVRILVTRSATTAAVAVVRNAPHPEIDKLQNYLLELGLTSQLFDKDGLTTADLDGFQLVLFHDAAQNGLNTADINLLAQLANGPTALYFIGDRLASAASSLPQSTRTTWMNLTGLGAASERSPANTVTADTTSGHPAVNGRFGVVGNFAYPEAIDRAPLHGGTAVRLAFAGDATVGTALDRESGLGRIVAHNTLVTSGTDPASIAERKKLFKNSVVWLLRKGFNAFTDLSLQLAALPATANAGEEVRLEWTLRQRGEVEASGVSLAISLPAQVQFVSAEFTQGDLQPSNGTLTYTPGNMESAAAVVLRMTVRAISAGQATFSGIINGNEADPNPNNNTATGVTQIQGSLATPPRLEVVRITPTTFQAQVHGDAGRSYVVEVSTNLTQWSPLTTVVGTSSGAAFQDTLPTGTAPAHRFYRARSSP